MELSLSPSSLPARYFYNSRPGSYIETRAPTGGHKVVEVLYSIKGHNG
jgi:hypothetical protein